VTVIPGRPQSLARIVVVALAVAAGCARTQPAVRPAPVSPPPPSPAPTTVPRPPAATHTQVGMATYYAARFAGRRTANGERYNPRAMTAAHRTLPFGTVLRVTRLDATGAPMGPPVVVRVNDRGPYARGRIIDLSMAAARRLDMVRAGVVRVRLEVMRE
jgi:rare lipoprotein A